MESRSLRARRTRNAVGLLQGSFAPQTCHRLDCELHEASDGRRCNLDSPRVIAGHYGKESMVARVLRACDVRSDDALSPMIGSKILIRGFISWFSR